MIKILILVDYSSDFSRKLLKGLVQFSKEHGTWIFYRLPSYYKTLHGKEGIIKWAKEWSADAIIAEWDQEEGINLLQTLDIPVILQNSKLRSSCFSNLTGDYIATGRMAAQFFARRRFDNFAFYGNKGIIWSKERAEGFQQEVERINGNFFHLETEDLRDIPWGKSHIELRDWLISLPKPIALLTCDDNFALQISETCKINGIQIPDEISLLGVDNDELICSLSDPPISSISLDVEKGGYDAGKLIYKLIKDKTHTPFNIVINPTRIVLRRSTEKYDISNSHISKIVAYIEQNFSEDIHIESLTKLVPLSRRSLEIKFKKEIGISIYQFVLDCRVEHFAMLLITTDRTFLDLALESGFSNSKNISRVFKKLKGCSPAEYRDRYKKI